jgi:membrane protease YdiL (CAAX protease family)
MRNTSKEESGHGSTNRAHGPAAFARRHGLVSFYALAYGLSWLAWLPYVLSQYGLGVLHISLPRFVGPEELVGQLVGILLGAYLGPLGAAFIVTALTEGRPGLRRWRGRLFRWGVGWRWYAFALIAVPAIIVAGTLALPGAAAGLRLPPLELFLVYVPFFALQMVTTGLAEEPGWRDFALVRHQRQHGPLLGTLILSLLWAGWHLPLFLTEWGAGIGGANPRTILLFVLLCVTLSVVITWVFNRTRESLPLAIVIHASNNTFASLLLAATFTTLDPSRDVLTGAVIGYGALALVLTLATRGRLGYGGPHDGQPEEGAGEEPGGVPAGHVVAGRRVDLPEAREA